MSRRIVGTGERIPRPLAFRNEHPRQPDRIKKAMAAFQERRVSAKISLLSCSSPQFNVQRHLTSARTHRAFRASALQTWREVVAAACARRARRFVTCPIWQCEKALRRDHHKSPLPVVICENDRGQSWYVCGQARYGREPQLRALSPLCARRVRDDGPPEGDDARRRGDKRRRGGGAHPPGASVTVPFTLLLPESEHS